MSDYPNMSYCMFQNTLLAMEQLNTFLAEARGEELMDISRDELRAMMELYNQCESFLNLGDDFMERRERMEAGFANEDMEEF
jgi:hypothetical protein